MLRRLPALLLLAVGLTACGDDPTGPDPQTGQGIVGETYALVSVDGETPPVILQSGSCDIEIIDWSITFTSDESYTLDADDRVRCFDGPWERAQTRMYGTYFIDSSDIWLRDEDGTTIGTGPFRGTSFSFDATTAAGNVSFRFVLQD